MVLPSFPESGEEAQGQQASSSLLGEFSVGAEAGRSTGRARLAWPLGPLYALLTLTLLLAGRGLVLAAVGGALAWPRGWGPLLVDGRRLADCRTASECSRAFMRRGGHAGRAVCLAAVGGEEGKPYGVGDTA